MSETTHRRAVLAALAGSVTLTAGCSGGGEMSIVAGEIPPDVDSTSVVTFQNETFQSIPPAVTAVDEADRHDDGSGDGELSESEWYDTYSKRLDSLHPADRGKAADNSRGWAFIRYNNTVYQVYPLNPE